MPNKTVSDPKVFVSIAPDGIVTIVAARAEMGTGAARTTLPMIVADELDADWAKVRIQQSPGDEVKYGNQDTDGSRSVRHFIQPMRLCGASARTMLEQAAAKRWGVEVAEVEAKNHEIVHRPSGPQARLRRGGGGRGRAAGAGAGRQVQLKEPSAFRYMGKGNVPVVDLFDITVGQAIYGQDVMLPGMKFAVDGAPAGGRRQGRVVRRDRGHEGAGRREGA